MKKLVVAFVLLVVLCLTVIGAASAGNLKDWGAAYTYDVAPGTFTPGFYPYAFEYTWTYPAPGGNYSGVYGSFRVDENAPLYPGYVVLRGELGGAYAKPMGENGRACIQVAEPVTIHPQQAVRFHIGWGTDYPMSPPEAKQHFQSMVTTVTWIDGGTHVMTGHEVTPSGNGNHWANTICSFTVRH